MKRSEALQPLSRDHHQALFVAQALSRADEPGAAAAASRFREFFDGHGRRHFEIEEELLLPELPAGGEHVERVLVEHAEMRRRADELGDPPPASELRELGRLLHDHVRYEERVLFPLLEEQLTAEDLVRLGKEVERAESDDG